MALSSECMDEYARKDLDTADIVRDGDLKSTTAQEDRLFSVMLPARACALHSDDPSRHDSQDSLSTVFPYLSLKVGSAPAASNFWTTRGLPAAAIRAL